MRNKNSKYLEYYSRYKDKIFNYIWYRVNFNQDLADDLTSEIFIKAYENFDGFDESRPFQAWIYKIAKNHLLNHYRTLGREVELAENLALAGRDREKMEAGLELERVFGVIRRLDRYEQEVLLLRFSDGLDNAEIAQILDKDEGAVRTQISRALKRLRELL